MNHSALSATAAHTNTLFLQYNALQALPFVTANNVTPSSIAAALTTSPYFPSAHSSSASPSAEMVKLISNNKPYHSLLPSMKRNIPMNNVDGTATSPQHTTINQYFEVESTFT
eukprot:7502062-Ditylum_brightwellii.AAC.1